ncbi:alpha/beta hydrolase [Rhodococcus erythropolis]|uniref:alpha/beta hydrolase n=1 Tax=Rhodococcus erythropolis TaxID=1833 RepID=UPI002948DF3E|nr:alpha/beta hydrolase [Rhodococcus erythropolis]MDV6212777.1 alpha/beta hydrolase [Rhodococcus erythropolis]
MPIAFDPEIASALTTAALATEGFDPPKRGDALALRELINPTFRASYEALDQESNVSTRDLSITASDGAVITARLYTPPIQPSGSAVVYVHGGGMICGSIDLYDPLVRYYSDLTGVPFLAVEYRLAPEYQGIRPAQDCFEATRWFYEHAHEFGVDPNRIAVMGDSGGGGLAASVAIQARDHGISLARQILIYPMLDDRNTDPDLELESTATWTYDNNFTAWQALIGESLGSESVSALAAPARLVNFENLAPAYIEIGELDIFRDESLSYAASLGRAGVSCELHVHPGAPHGYEWIAPESRLAGRAIAERVRVASML